MLSEGMKEGKLEDIQTHLHEKTLDEVEQVRECSCVPGQSGRAGGGSEGMKGGGRDLTID